jgi:hypothetical protein
MDIVVVADLGAAGNLVRNLLLLSEQTDWPLSTNRFVAIANQYKPNNNLSQWLTTEYQLRFWNKHYGVDISNDINLSTFVKRNLASNPVVYLNHSAFYQHTEYQQLKEFANIVYVAPTTEFGLKWQIRSYCEKKTVELLHNFTFDSDINNQRTQYCHEHGVDAYHRLNIKNFTEIVKQRQQDLGKPDVPLELLLFGNIEQVVDILFTRLNIVVDLALAKQILTKWQECHWPLAETDNWKYYDNNA